MDKRGRVVVGVLLTLVSAFSVAAMGVCAKIVSKDISNDTILLARFLVSLIIVFPFLLTGGATIRIPRQYLPWLITRSTMGLFSIAACFYCMLSMPVANAVLLMNTAPIFVPLLVWFLTGIRTHGPVLIGILISVVGVAIVLHPGHGLLSWVSLVGVLSGFCAALAMVILRRLGKALPVNTMLLNYYIIGIIILAIFLPFGWRTPKPSDWVWMVGVGVFGFCYQWCMAKALQFTQIRVVAPVTLSSVLFGALLDWLVWGHVPDWQFWIGGITLVIGIVVVIDCTHRRSLVED